MTTENLQALIAYRLEQAQESLDKETSRHSGAISMFDREFVRKGSFEKKLSRWFHDAFDLRQRSDYAADVRITQEEASVTFEHGRSFVTEVKAFLQDKLK